MAESPSTELDAIAHELSLPLDQVSAVAKLIDEGNTPAFITRFRRQVSGGLNESRILDIKRLLNLQRSLAERKSIILKSIETQEKLTGDLTAAIQSAQTSKQLEDLYLPFKPKKQSLGQLARQRGLEPLAQDIFQGVASESDLATRATDYVRVDKGLHTIDDVVKGVGHLIAERFADDVSVRSRCRENLWKSGRIVTRKIEPLEAVAATQPAATETSPVAVSPTSEPDQVMTPVEEVSPAIEIDALAVATEVVTEDESPVSTASSTALEETSNPAAVPLTAENNPPAPTDPLAAAPPASDADKKKRRRKKKTPEHDPFKDYADFSESISKLVPYRTLAINRAERARSIRVKAKMDDAQYNDLIKSMVPENHAFGEFMEKCAQDAVQRFVLPSLEREIRRELTEDAEQHALKVFGRNLRHLLLKPPVRGRRVVAIDPGFRYGCQAAALDEFGHYLGHAVFQVVGNEQRRAEGRQKLAELINTHQCQMIAIGNGSACRETEQLVSDLINGDLAGRNLEYVIVNEAGTNAYSTSDIGREELPNCEPSIRSAVSIGRRLLDPLSDLVKVDPAHLGIGLYQHDIKAKHLAHELDEVVASCVNYVGVDANSSSPALLAHVSGLGPLAARRLYEYRLQHGPFRQRQQFKEVSGIGEQTFIQAAGFLRIVDGDNPLDATMVHPESYELATKILEKAGFLPIDLRVVPSRPPVPIETPATTASDPPSETSTPVPQVADTPAVAVAELQYDQQQLHHRRGQLRDALHKLDRHGLANEFGVSPLVIGDLIHALLQAGVDPRERLPAVVFRRGIIKLENLEPQMQLSAQVVNVVDFGVFVDIGLGESSLVHISRLSDGFVSDPHLMFAVGDTLDVWVTQLDTQRRRVMLTAVRPGSERPSAPRGRHRPSGPPRQAEPSHAAPRGPRADRSAPPPRDRDKKPYPHKPKRFEATKRVNKPPRPVTPITPEMVEGKAPMRSFSDLAQFFTKKNDPEKGS